MIITPKHTSQWWQSWMPWIILANCNFQLYYGAWKTNIDVDALSRVSWPSCMPKTSGTHHQDTAMVVWVLQEAAALKGPTSPVETFSCDLHVLGMVGGSPQVTCMIADDWHQAQRADPVLSLVIMRMQDGTLGQSPCKLTDLPELGIFLWKCNHLKQYFGHPSPGTSAHWLPVPEAREG